MDELILPGTVSLIILYAGIALVMYGILRVLIWVIEAALFGNYLIFCGILTGIAGIVIAYILIGLWLRRIEII
jgi:hypothetical protein